jgi:phage gp16-like protein
VNAHRSPDAARKARLARIHLAKKTLGLCEDTYRDLLARVTGLRSCADMTAQQHHEVLAEFVRLGFRDERAEARAAAFKARPKNVKDVPLLRKAEALLADGKKPWAYGHAMAKRMFKVARVEWLTGEQLRRLVAALEVDARRHAKGAR